MTNPAPLILTLTLDDAAQAHFNDLRQQHFPPKINYLAAHVTLFHHLPPAELDEIKQQLADLCAAQPLLPLHVAGLRFLGRGVAFNLENADLRTLHRRLQTDWQHWLTPQDQQKLNPHVTIQNKVESAVSRQLLTDLQDDFEPFEAIGTGLRLWAYRGGPWEELATFPFGGGG